MPATFSRRKATRRNDMSDIEDDAATQHAAQDDVEESDEEPTSRRFKKEKRNRRAQQEVNNDPDSDSDEAIDIENFPDQPLKRDQMSTLLSLGDDWQKMVEVIGRPFGKYGMAAGALADLDDEDAKVRVDEIDGYTRESLDLVGIMKAHKDALNGIRQKGLQGEPLTQVGELYIQAAKTNVSKYKAKTTRQKYAKDEVYVAFKSSVWESQHPGTPMPPITEQIPREQGDNSDEDDDLEIGGVTQNYQCPITLTLLDDPSFSAAAIKTTFRTPSAINKCPAAGCNKSFRLVDCKPNKDLAKKVKAHKRRLEKEQEDSDAEEVVD
ncbi:E3 SUMO-protein ligase nse2 [Leucoagaricus sp. SymC.cos]|nr:E3 SUMO-protein ligase nse2 [Leucoagaricus sp. SymC.cos]